MAAKQGDKAGREVVDNYMNYITCGLVNLVNIFCPDAILIGGGISNEKEYLTDPIKRLSTTADSARNSIRPSRSKRQVSKTTREYLARRLWFL